MHELPAGWRNRLAISIREAGSSLETKRRGAGHAQNSTSNVMLMNQKAVNSFMQDNKFSLTADAGLTIVDYTAKAQATAGRGDAVVWRVGRNIASPASIRAGSGTMSCFFHPQITQIIL